MSLGTRTCACFGSTYTKIGNKNLPLLSFFMVYGQFCSISYGSGGQQDGLTVKMYTLRMSHFQCFISQKCFLFHIPEFSSRKDVHAVR